MSENRSDSWIAEAVGDKAAGELVRYETGTTAYGECHIAVLREADGRERSVWLFTVLKNAFAKLRPKPGEVVTVTYLGKKTGKSGRAYNDFEVTVDREEDDYDF